MAIGNPVAHRDLVSAQFGASSLSTSGTKYLYPGNSSNTASAGVKRMRAPCATTRVDVYFCNTAAGTGAGDYTHNLCTVSGDVASPTGITTGALATSSRTSDMGGTIALTLGQEIALQVVVNGTVTSPADTTATIVFT